jgi:UDP-N-acetylglucosamine--N-acetylmuramyl-(pentapeptide) pyrophosphoryl-undecaprenol N-acetylglucosamine transferase
MTRIALAAGGTAGHVYPALAVADALREEDPSIEIIVMGSRNGVEEQIVPRSGYRLELLPALPYYRTSTRGRLMALFTVPANVASASRLLARESIDAIIGFGGYASVAPMLAARMRGLPVAIVEPNVIMGKANRLLRRAAGRAYVHFRSAARSMKEEVIRVVGVPIRHEVAELNHEERPVPAAPARILVLSSSQYSPFLDERAPGLMKKLAAMMPVEVVHQSMNGESAELVRRYGSVRARHATFIERIADAYRQSDFVISRCGASTLAELACAGLPALVVPLAVAAERHQEVNADWVVASGAAISVTEETWDEDRQAERIAGILRDEHRWREMSTRARALAQPDAAGQLAEDFSAFVAQRLVDFPR